MTGNRERESLTLAERELYYRIHWLIRLRWIVGLFGFLWMLFSWYVFGFRFAAVLAFIEFTPMPDSVDNDGVAPDIKPQPVVAGTKPIPTGEVAR